MIQCRFHERVLPHTISHFILPFQGTMMSKKKQVLTGLHDVISVTHRAREWITDVTYVSSMTLWTYIKANRTMYRRWNVSVPSSLSAFKSKKKKVWVSTRRRDSASRSVLPSVAAYNPWWRCSKSQEKNCRTYRGRHSVVFFGRPCVWCRVITRKRRRRKLSWTDITGTGYVSHTTLRRLNGSTVGDWSSENIVHRTHYISTCISTNVYTQPRAHSCISTRPSYIRSVLVGFVCARWPWLQGSAFCTLKSRHIVSSCPTAIGPASATVSPVGSKRKTTWRNLTLPWCGAPHVTADVTDVNETA